MALVTSAAAQRGCERILINKTHRAIKFINEQLTLDFFGLLFNRNVGGDVGPFNTIFACCCGFGDGVVFLFFFVRRTVLSDAAIVR